jgi:membrane protein implicated in regulation of membrane protease activity
MTTPAFWLTMWRHQYIGARHFMAESTLWWLLTGAAVAVELVSGTFYLLMLAFGTAAAALAAHAGASVVVQMLTAAVLGGGAVLAWHVRRIRAPQEPSAQANANVNLDIGALVHIEAWNPDGTADVHYRGARWTAIHRPGVIPSPGPHRISELVGSQMLVDKN